MKKNQWIYWAVAAGVIYWWWKKKGSPTAQKAAPVLEAAKEVASEVVNNAVDATNFVMDDTTDRQLYAKDRSNCQ
jgi:hypothetical protein